MNFRFNPRWVLAGVMLILAALVLVWLSQPQPDDSLQRVQARGVLRIVTDASYPPFAAVDANGNLFGLDVALGEELARRLGVRAEFENLTYDALIGSLLVDRSDVVISAYVPQPERGREASFSTPYFVGGLVWVVPLSATAPPADVLTWLPGRTLAAEIGSAGDAQLRVWARQTAAFAGHTAPTADDALWLVANGQASAALTDAVSAYAFAANVPQVQVILPPVEPEPYTLVVSAQNPALLAELNRLLAELEADGTLPALRATWIR